MKKSYAFAASVSALLLAGAAMAHDDENKVSKTYDLAGFDEIDVGGVYELDVKVGPAFSVVLSGNERDMARVEVSVKDGALKLGQRDRARGDRNRNHDHGVNAVITLPSLVGLDVSGVVEGKVENIDAENFEVNISGVGEVELFGECGSLDANVSGVGDLDAEELKCRRVDVRLSGVGDASVYASDEVDAKVSGMGDIDVYGSPKKVDKSKGMFSDITIH